MANKDIRPVGCRPFPDKIFLFFSKNENFRFFRANPDFGLKIVKKHTIIFD